MTRQRALAARAARQDELLETAQEFGRLGIWERAIPSGEGRWDKHVFGFWGIDPAEGTPHHDDAIAHIHPEDRARGVYPDSTRRAGRYAQRYRVIQRDGKTRWIHSQWEVKNGPRGVPDRALGVMMDDTEVYEAARALSDVNAQLKLAVELGKIAIWRRDLRTGRMHFSDVGVRVARDDAASGRTVGRRGGLVDPPRRHPARPRIGRAGAGIGPSRSTWRRAIAAATAAGATC